MTTYGILFNTIQRLASVRLLAFCIATALTFTASAKDGNEALYDATAPAGSAFVRVVNLAELTASVGFTGKTSQQNVGSRQIGDYVFFEGGQEQTVSVNGVQLGRTFPKQSAWTLVFDGSSLTPLEDKYFTGRKKAQVGFYNLSSQPLDLKTADGKHAVVEGTAPMTSGQRDINEVKIALAAWADGAEAAAFEPVFLKKGRSYSYVVYQQADELKSMVVADSITALE